MLFNFGGVLVLVMVVGKLVVEWFLRENWTSIGFKYVAKQEPLVYEHLLIMI